VVVTDAKEYDLPTGSGRIRVREVGDGPPLVVLHGGPGLDHRYLVPDLDALAASFRVVYYAQRGRGASHSGEGPEEVSIASDVADLDQLRRHLGESRVALLGHSWGGLVATEYALAHPQRVSRLVLLSPSPVSHAGHVAQVSEWTARRTPEQAAELERISADPAYQAGDIAADAAYALTHFASTVVDPAHLETLVGKLRLSYTPATIVAVRAISRRLLAETLLREDYDLLPRLRELPVPTMVITGDDEFAPMSVMRGLAEAIPGARLEVLAGAGHFPYLERPDDCWRLVSEFAAP